MATIQKLERKDGPRYRVLIRRQGHKSVTRVFEKKKLAEEWARQMEGNVDHIDDFPDAAARRHTVKDAIDGFVASYRGKDQIILGRLAWWAEHCGDMPLSKFRQGSVRDALKQIAAEPARAASGASGKTRVLATPKSSGTINRYHGAISIAMRWAVDAKWITRNPALGIPRLKEPRGRVRWLDDDERNALLAACDASSWPELGLLVRLALSTGARLSELLRLRWSSMDLKRGLAYIADSKNDEPRALPLVKPVREMLERKPRPLRDALLFPAAREPKAPAEAPERPYAFREAWNAAVREAGLADFRFHDLRHSCASYLAMAGASHVEIADVLGHKTLAMVKRYSHLNTEHKQQLLERVTGRLVGGDGAA